MFTYKQKGHTAETARAKRQGNLQQMGTHPPTLLPFVVDYSAKDELYS